MELLIGGPPSFLQRCGIFPCSRLDIGQEWDIVDGGVGKGRGVGVTTAALTYIQSFENKQSLKAHNGECLLSLE